MKNTDSLAENVLEKSEKEIELYYYTHNSIDFNTFLSSYNIDKSYQCHAYFFDKNKESSDNIIEVSSESLKALLSANLSLRPNFGKDCLIIWRHFENFVICGKFRNEIEPLCILSPRTSSVPWSCLRFMAISDIARQENLEYYGYDSYLTIVNLKNKRRRYGRKRVLLSEGSATIESILQQ